MSEGDDRRVWIVTGGSSGFGWKSSQAALSRGDRVVATARRAERLEDLVRGAPERAHALALDVTDPEGIRPAVDEVLERFGRVDVLVNNAGHGGRSGQSRKRRKRSCVRSSTYTSSGRPRWSAPFCRRCAVGGPAL